MRTKTTSSVLLLIVLALAVSPVLAQDGGDFYIVQPGDNLYRIAKKFDTTVEALMAANNITDPNHIVVGQRLVIPTGTGQPAAGAATTSTTGAASASSWAVEAGKPIYSGDGHVIDIPVTIHNNSVSPEIAGGKWTSTLKPDGLYEDMALAKAAHGDFEQPLLGNSLVWQAVVHTSDGKTHLAAAGCIFIEHVFAQGDEPLDRAPDGTWLKWFHYEVNLFDGWFDCGNTYRINPANIKPGASGKSLLRVYLVNPHNKALYNQVVGTPYPLRTVTSLDVTVFKQDGAKVGTQSVTVSP